MQKSRSTLLDALEDRLEGPAAFLLPAGQFSSVLMILYLIWQERVDLGLRQVEIEPVFPIAAINILMFVSSPFLIYSGAVGMWRMQGLPGRVRALGILASALLLLPGLANVILPVVFAVGYFR